MDELARLEVTMKTIIIAAILLLAAPAHATSTNFFIFFDDSPSGFITPKWSGQYTITDGVLTAFSALVGICSNPFFCTYDILFNIAARQILGHHQEALDLELLMRSPIGRWTMLQ